LQAFKYTNRHDPAHCTEKNLSRGMNSFPSACRQIFTLINNIWVGHESKAAEWKGSSSNQREKEPFARHEWFSIGMQAELHFDQQHLGGP
jgi:hypothetical protein